MTDSAALSHADLFAPSTRRNPYPMYHQVRADHPVWHDPAIDEWVLTRYADCEAVLRDPRWSTDNRHRRSSLEQPLNDIRDAFLETNANVLLFLDPPDHTRLRRLVSKAFTPRRIEQLRSHVEDLTDGLLDDAGASRDGFEVIADLAYPLPTIVICELMGVPPEDRHQFSGWSSDASRLLDGDVVDDQAVLLRGLAAMAGFINYFNGLFDERRAQPRDDLVSHLLAVEEEGDRLTEEELRAIVLLVFIAGHETTMNLIGNGLFALLDHRDQWDLLCADPPARAPGAVEELLRFDGPVHLTARIATAELEVGGQRFRPGEQVIPLLAAANRDPERFPDPDRLDIERPENHHLTFSHGIHYCLGAALARMEGQVVFRRLAERFPQLELACSPDDVEYREHFVLRGLKQLPVRL